MISLETAKALKDAGLEWNPQLHDKYLTAYCFKVPTAVIFNPEKCKWEGTEVWLPRLDQLLQEIERRGWKWAIDGSSINDEGKYNCWAMNKDKCKVEFADTPEEASALALLWILRGASDE